ALVEAALYSAGRALTIDELARTTRLEPEAIKSHLRALAGDYTKRESALEIAQIGTKWTMQIREAYSERARAFAPPEIDRDILKTVALIAYHQPILQSDLFDMIGSKVYEHTKDLEELGLISRKPSGRSFALATTRYFAEFFGLKSTDREGIRRMMAQKAGVRYTERTEATPSDDPLSEAPPPASPVAEAVAQPASSPAATPNGRERRRGGEGPRRGERGDGLEGLQGRRRQGGRGPRTGQAHLPGAGTRDRRFEFGARPTRERRRRGARGDRGGTRESRRRARLRGPRHRDRPREEGVEAEREGAPGAPVLLVLEGPIAHPSGQEPEPRRRSGRGPPLPSADRDGEQRFPERPRFHERSARDDYG